MPALSDDQWQSLILAACNDDKGLVATNLDDLWQRYAYLQEADPSGDLRYYAVLRDGLDFIIADLRDEVQASEGGGQSAAWQQRWDHAHEQRTIAEDGYKSTLSRVQSAAGLQVDAMSNTSMTPVLPGYMDPGSPAYQGDPRYQYGAGWPWPQQGPKLG